MLQKKTGNTDKHTHTHTSILTCRSSANFVSAGQKLPPEITEILIFFYSFQGFVSDDLKARLNHQKLDANHSLILLSTILMFCLFHIPRVIISIYNAITINSVLKCKDRQKGFYTIWYLYAQYSLQFVQVQIFLVKCSHNQGDGPLLTPPPPPANSPSSTPPPPQKSNKKC